MKELPDSFFNMRREFYEDSKRDALLKRRPFCTVHIFLVYGEENAKKIPDWFLIQEIGNGFFQVHVVHDQEFLKHVEKRIIKRRGIDDI